MNDQKRIEATLVSLDAEQAILGACLFENDLIDQAADILSDEDFYDPVHGLIFNAICVLRSQGRLANPITLHAYLQGSRGYQDANGQKYLEQMAAAVPSTASALDYARHVAELHQRRGLYEIGKELQERAADMPPDDSPRRQSDEVEEALAALFDRDGKASSIKSAKSAMAQWMEDQLAREGEPPGHPTGLDELDDKLGGLRPGKLYIIGGRPAMGKSTSLIHLARRMADAGGVGFVSAEMEATELPVMMATDVMRDQGIRLPYLQAEKGVFSEREYAIFSECAAEIAEKPILIDETNQPSLGHVRRFAAHCARKFKAMGVPFRALMVDYLQTMGKNPRLRGTEAISELTKGLIAVGKKYGVPVIVGSQINRGPEGREDKRPTMADLRESGDIENDAYAVILLYREAYYHARSEPPKDKAQKHEDWEIERSRLMVEKPQEWIIAKNRRGPTGTVITWCEIETGAIRHRAFNPHDPTGQQPSMEEMF